MGVCPNLEKGGPRKGGAPNSGGPKISRFFFPFLSPFHSFCVSPGVFRGILVVF